MAANIAARIANATMKKTMKAKKKGAKMNNDNNQMLTHDNFPKMMQISEHNRIIKELQLENTELCKIKDNIIRDLRRSNEETNTSMNNVRKTWDEFRKTGLLWWINRQLHLFGWTIIVEVDTETNKVNECYPSKCNYNGFSHDSEERGFSRVRKILRDI